MCPLVNELKTRQEVETIVCVTGQHRQMLDQVLEALDVYKRQVLDRSDWDHYDQYYRTPKYAGVCCNP